MIWALKCYHWCCYCTHRHNRSMEECLQWCNHCRDHPRNLESFRCLPCTVEFPRAFRTTRLRVFRTTRLRFLRDMSVTHQRSRLEVCHRLCRVWPQPTLRSQGQFQGCMRGNRDSKTACCCRTHRGRSWRGGSTPCWSSGCNKIRRVLDFSGSQRRSNGRSRICLKWRVRGLEWRVRVTFEWRVTFVTDLGNWDY